jgi:hypothetical protein
MSSSWRDVLQQQHDEIDRLEAEDAALNDVAVTEEADKILRKPDSISFAASTMRKAKMGGSRGKRDEGLGLDLHLPEAKMEGGDYGEVTQSSTARSSNSARGGSGRGNRSSIATEQLGSPDGATPPAFAVDANARYNKARTAQMQQQLDNSEQLRLKLNEQCKGLERELKSEREEGKKLRKQVQLFEADQRRNARSGSAPSASGGANDPASLRQEIAALKKDVLTAERIVKQGEAATKAKDTQLKRATETIARMKTHVSELTDKGDGDDKSERARADAAEARVKVLEKQRLDLIAAFKKQMKLIDVLKRQKMHIEAARLLSFTEEEFVKALDWSL